MTQILLFFETISAESSNSTIRLIGYGIIAIAALGYVYWQRRKDKKEEQ